MATDRMICLPYGRLVGEYVKIRTRLLYKFNISGIMTGKNIFPYIFRSDFKGSSVLEGMLE